MSGGSTVTIWLTYPQCCVPPVRSLMPRGFHGQACQAGEPAAVRAVRADHGRYRRRVRVGVLLLHGHRPGAFVGEAAADARGCGGPGGSGVGVGAVRVRRMAADRVPDRRPCHRAVRQAYWFRPRGAERGHGQGERRRALPLRPPWQALALGAAAAAVRRQRGPRSGPDGRDRRFVHVGGRPHAPFRRRLPRHDRGRYAGGVDGSVHRPALRFRRAPCGHRRRARAGRRGGHQAAACRQGGGVPVRRGGRPRCVFRGSPS